VRPSKFSSSLTLGIARAVGLESVQELTISLKSLMSTVSTYKSTKGTYVVPDARPGWVSALEGFKLIDVDAMIEIVVLCTCARGALAGHYSRAVGLMGVLEITRLVQPSAGAAGVGALVRLYLVDVQVEKGEKEVNGTNIEEVDESTWLAVEIGRACAALAGGQTDGPCKGRRGKSKSNDGEGEHNCEMIKDLKELRVLRECVGKSA
jgi:hypothetical protein